MWSWSKLSSLDFPRLLGFPRRLLLGLFNLFFISRLFMLVVVALSSLECVFVFIHRRTFSIYSIPIVSSLLSCYFVPHAAFTPSLIAAICLPLALPKRVFFIAEAKIYPFHDTVVLLFLLPICVRISLSFLFTSIPHTTPSCSTTHPHVSRMHNTIQHYRNLLHLSPSRVSALFSLDCVIYTVIRFEPGLACMCLTVYSCICSIAPFSFSSISWNICPQCSCSISWIPTHCFLIASVWNNKSEQNRAIILFRAWRELRFGLLNLLETLRWSRKFSSNSGEQ